MNKLTRFKTIFSSLQHRNYRLFFWGQMVSLTGTWMQSVAQSWLIYHLTHSALLLGVVGFANQIPSFILAPLGGVYADRHSRHRILVITQIFSMILALTLAALTLLGVIEVWHILLLSVLFGIVNAFDIPARQAFMVEMVGKEDLVNGTSYTLSFPK